MENESFTEIFETPGWKTQTRADLERKLGLHLIQEHEIPLAGSRVTLVLQRKLQLNFPTTLLHVTLIRAVTQVQPYCRQAGFHAPE